MSHFTDPSILFIIINMCVLLCEWVLTAHIMPYMLVALKELPGPLKSEGAHPGITRPSHGRGGQFGITT